MSKPKRKPRGVVARLTGNDIECEGRAGSPRMEWDEWQPVCRKPSRALKKKGGKR